MTERYRPDHVTQEDGSQCQWTNCWATAGAWAADGSTAGRKRPTPTEFRKAAKAMPTGKLRCRPGGLGDIIRGLRSLGAWKQSRYVADMSKERLLRRLRGNPGVLVILETDFEVWPDGKSCQPGFTDRDDAYHMIGVICGEDGQDRVAVMDPLCHRYRWVKVQDVVRAAIRYNDEHRGEEKGTVDAVLIFPPKQEV